MTISIGAVVFWHNGKPLHLMGRERYDMLRKVYRREVLPEGVEVRSDWYSGNAPLTWEDIAWETSSIPQEG